jgi:SSS family solute:Na+ symporter
MRSHWLDSVILALYLALTVVVGFVAARRRREGVEDYFLAGRSLTLPMFVATLVTTFYGGVLGVGEYSWSNGLSNWVVMGAPYYLFAAIYALFFAGKIRLAPGLTIPDHLETAYGRGLAVFAALLLFVMMSPADDILMIGTLLQWVSGFPLRPCMAAATVGALLYLYRGGLRSDVWTNRLQIVVMFGGFFLILPYAYFKLGGWAYLTRHLPPAHLTWTGGKSFLNLTTWYFIGIWTLIDPTFHQRACAAKDPQTARRGILISIAFWCVFDCMTTLAGLYARALMPALDNPIMAYPLLAERLMPPFVRGLFLAGVTSSMIASLDGRTLVSAISLAKDALGRWRDASGEEQERWSKWAVALAGLLGLGLALFLPSVVGLWYAIGSTINPALLFPLLSIYIPAIRIAPRIALWSALAGWFLSTSWFLCGQIAPPNPLGIEPMYPGLAASAALWTYGLIKGKAGRD